MVTSDVSRILWLYYNDSVSRRRQASFLSHLLIRSTADLVLYLCRKRAFLRLTLSHEMGRHPNRPAFHLCRPDDRAGHGHLQRPHFCHQEHYQCCSVMESLQDPCWRGSCREGDGEAGAIGETSIICITYPLVYPTTFSTMVYPCDVQSRGAVIFNLYVYTKLWTCNLKSCVCPRVHVILGH